jgi:hypothetical protein
MSHILHLHTLLEISLCVIWCISVGVSDVYLELGALNLLEELHDDTLGGLSCHAIGVLQAGNKLRDVRFEC